MSQYPFAEHLLGKYADIDYSAKSSLIFRFAVMHSDPTGQWQLHIRVPQGPYEFQVYPS